MSEQKHTQEPWSLSEDSTSILDKDGFAIADVTNVAVLDDYDKKLRIPHWADSPLASRDISEEEQEATARRIVACVNACAGIPTEALDAGVLHDIGDELQQRDELLATLKEINAIALHETMSFEEGNDRIAEISTQAITKVESK